MRLDQLLQMDGQLPRKWVKRLLLSKQVTVDGVIMLDGSVNVDPSWHDIRVNGRRVEKAGHQYFVLNKPPGVVTAVHDKLHQTVVDLLKPADLTTGLHPVGRLDRDTAGLVFLTNNGKLGRRLIAPEGHVAKVYLVTVNGLVGEEAVAAFEKGVVFNDGTRLKSAKLEVISANSTLSRCKVTIWEGKFHQIKKMFLTQGVKVTSLRRIKLGPISLEDELPEGAYRQLTKAEQAALKTYF